MCNAVTTEGGARSATLRIRWTKATRRLPHFIERRDSLTPRYARIIVNPPSGVGRQFCVYRLYLNHVRGSTVLSRDTFRGKYRVTKCKCRGSRCVCVANACKRSVSRIDRQRSGSGANGGSDLERCWCDDAAKVAARMIDDEKIGANLMYVWNEPTYQKKGGRYGSVWFVGLSRHPQASPLSILTAALRSHRLDIKTPSQDWSTVPGK